MPLSQVTIYISTSGKGLPGVSGGGVALVLSPPTSSRARISATITNNQFNNKIMMGCNSLSNSQKLCTRILTTPTNTFIYGTNGRQIPITLSRVSLTDSCDKSCDRNKTIIMSFRLLFFLPSRLNLKIK